MPMQDGISQHSLRRLPFYLTHLKLKQNEGIKYISSAQIAKDLELNEIQVKKDLAYVTSENGKPNVGHPVDRLIQDLEAYLGYHNTTSAVLIGAGHLGKALMQYEGFREYGLQIVLAFDQNPELYGTSIQGISILPIDEMESLCQRMHINIGIITVGAKNAQSIAEKLIHAGVRAIWNFAPVKIVVPDSILVQNENMASSLAVLSRHLTEKIRKEEEL